MGHDRTGADRCAFADDDSAQDRCVRSDRCPAADPRLHDGPVLGSLELTALRRRAREFVVREHHAMADEDLVFDNDAFANETVR